MRVLSLFFALALILNLSGCAAYTEMQSAQMERSLLSSGFKIIPANTPNRRDSLARLKPYQVQRKIRNGSVYYLYADPKQGALYVGDQAAYTEYQGYAVQRQIAENSLFTGDEYASETLGWGDWDFWGAQW